MNYVFRRDMFLPCFQITFIKIKVSAPLCHWKILRTLAISSHHILEGLAETHYYKLSDIATKIFMVGLIIIIIFNVGFRQCLGNFVLLISVCIFPLYNVGYCLSLGNNNY